MRIEELTALDAAGFIAGRGESEDAYLARVERIRAAHAGGMKAIAIASSFPAEFLQENAGPDYLIGDMHELLDILP